MIDSFPFLNCSFFGGVGGGGSRGVCAYDFHFINQTTETEAELPTWLMKDNSIRNLTDLSTAERY